MAERYENDRWRGDDDRYRDERDLGRDRDDRGRWFDRDRGADRDRWSERDRGDRGMMARGADEVRSWFGDDRAERRREIDELHDRANEWRDRPRWSQGARPSGIGREWPGRSSEAAWEGGGRIDRSTRDYPGDYERGRFLRDRSDRSPWGDFDPDGRARGGDGPSASAADRHRSGYYDSSMGYASVPTAGGLNPFRYGGPGSFAGRGPRNYQRSDERIREDVVARLTDDARVDASDIDVSVQNGEVRLSGTVQDRRMRRAAEECIEEMPGVRDVHNDLRVDDKVGELGHAGSPLEREDVTSLDISGAQAKAKAKR